MSDIVWLVYEFNCCLQEMMSACEEGDSEKVLGLIGSFNKTFKDDVSGRYSDGVEYLSDSIERSFKEREDSFARSCGERTRRRFADIAGQRSVHRCSGQRKFP